MNRLFFVLLTSSAIIAYSFYFSFQITHTDNIKAKAAHCLEYGIVQAIGPVAGRYYAVASTGAAMELKQITKIGDTICVRYEE
jgi:hypothetical protein